MAGEIECTHRRVAQFCYFVKDYYCVVLNSNDDGLLGVGLWLISSLDSGLKTAY